MTCNSLELFQTTTNLTLVNSSSCSLSWWSWVLIVVLLLGEDKEDECDIRIICSLLKNNETMCEQLLKVGDFLRWKVGEYTENCTFYT